MKVRQWLKRALLHQSKFIDPPLRNYSNIFYFDCCSFSFVCVEQRSCNVKKIALVEPLRNPWPNQQLFAPLTVCMMLISYHCFIVGIFESRAFQFNLHQCSECRGKTIRSSRNSNGSIRRIYRSS